MEVSFWYYETSVAIIDKVKLMMLILIGNCSLNFKSHMAFGILQLILMFHLNRIFV